MVVVLLNWAYVSAISFLFGFGLLHLLTNRELDEGEPRPALPLVVLAGLAVTACLANLLSLVINLGLLANILLILAGMAVGSWLRQPIWEYLRKTFVELHRLHWLAILAFLAVAGVVLLKSTTLPENYDTGLYHAQAIRWIETFPAVAGLGNLADRLVFNSSWLILSALFSFSFFGLPSLHSLNGLIALLVTGYALSKFDRLYKGEIHLGTWLAIALPFLLRRIFSLELSSPGTDLPAALMVWVVILLSLEKLERNSLARRDVSFWLVLVLSFFAVTVKLSVLPVLILGLFFLFLSLSAGDRQVGKGVLVVAVGLAALFFVPWMARSMVQSGYLIYPLWQVNIAQPDWQIPLENAQGTANWIRSWAKIATDQREMVEQMAVFEWLPIWYRNLVSLDRQVVILNMVSIFALACLSIYQIWKKGVRAVVRSPLLVVFVTVLAGIAFWFYQAPAPRFGYGFLAIFPVLCLAPFAQYVFVRLPRFHRMAASVMLAALLVYQGASMARMANFDQLIPVLVLPQAYPETETEAHIVDGITLYTPASGDQCWYEDFPCAPFIDTALELRGDQLSNGFFIRP